MFFTPSVGRRAKRHSSPQSDGASRASGRSSESGSGSSQSRRKAVTTLSTKTSPGQISDAGELQRISYVRRDTLPVSIRRVKPNKVFRAYHLSVLIFVSDKYALII